MTRRDAVRLLLVLAAAAGTPSMLSACGAEDHPPPADWAGGDAGDADLVSSDRTRAAGDPAAIGDVVGSVAGLGGSLFGALRDSPGNLVLSPYSVAVALAMTVNGAAGETAEEMRDVLAVEDLDTFNAGLNALTAYVEGLAGKQQRGDGSPAELTLAAANALFGQRDTAWETPFLDALAGDYGAGMRQVDYLGDTEAARTQINEWTAAQTRDRIPEILPEGTVDALTRLVLVNAIYLKAPWEEPFLPAVTTPKPFTTDDGRTVQAATMSGGLAASGHARGDGWEAVRIPYAGRALAMTVVLPDAGQVESVSAAVAGGGLGEILAASRDQRVLVSLPKWEFRTQAMLKPILEALGMATAFDPGTADFSGMTTEEQLSISAVVHEAFIAVDEEGTEAAAATAVVAGTTSVPEYVEVVVDRPFLFVIHDVEHGTPLFLGRIGDPTA